MKQLTTALFFLTSFFSVHLLSAQTADEVVDQYVKAMGGKEKLASLKTVKKTGGLTVQGTDVIVVVTAVNGVGARNDISVMGQDGFQITTPTKGWAFMPFLGQAGTEEISADDVQSSQHLVDIQGLLFDYKAKGSQVELLGKDTVEGAECHQLKLTSKDGKIYTMFIDAKTGYCVRIVSRTSTSGAAADLVTDYLDFKKTDEGYIFPFAQTTPRGTIYFTSIETNKPVDEKIFSAN
jgi:hypothetical protein